MGILDGKVALVTGAGRGIGREVALDMAKGGAMIVVNDLGGSVEGENDGESPADSVVKEIKAMGGEAVANADPVSDGAGAKAMVECAMDSFGSIDAVVNVAGILRDRMFPQDGREADWKAVIDVHLNGCFLVSRAAVDHMKNSGRAARSCTSPRPRVCMVPSVRPIMVRPRWALPACRRSSPWKVSAMACGPTAWRPSLDPDDRESIPITSDEMAESFRKFKENATAAHIAPVVSYLCFDSASEVTANIFGVRGNEIYLFSQPRPIKTIHKGDGWTHEALASHFEPSFRKELLDLDGTAEYFAWDPI